MPVIRLVTRMRAPIQVCFDKARDIDLHVDSMKSSSERAIAGVTRGLIGMDQEVTWEGVHFGIRQRLTSRITAFDPPRWFQDTMTRGAFKRLRHDHLFEHADGVTTMTDVFDYESPCGVLGRIANTVFLDRYLRHILAERAGVIRLAAERA